MFSQWWWSSGAEANDSGVEIGQSLRFRGNQTLTSPTFGSANTFGDNWSISFWVKFAGPIDTTRQIIATGTRTAGGNYAILDLNDTVQGQLQAYGSTTFTFNGRKLRDPSAWYHFVMSNDQIYINGESQGASSGYWSNFNGCDIFGFSNWGGTPNSKATMYLADVYLVQQTLQPEAFGRENDQGVWVPREVDFTPATMRFSDMVTFNPAPIPNAGGAWNAGDPAILFNGNDQQFIQTTTGAATNSIVFAPVGGIEFTTSVEIRMFNNANETVQLNNNAAITLPAQGGAGQRVFLAQDTAGTLETITCTGINGGAPSQIWVDGNPLLNPFIWSADLSITGSTLQNPQNAFDGNTGTECNESGSMGTIIWAPSADVQVNTQLRVHVQANMQVSWAGGAEVAGTGGWIVIPGTGAINATRTINFRATGSFANVSAIEVDGQIYVDGANPSYGASGFHLDFADPDDLGHDSSGNGNDFTATNFNTNPVGIFSNDLTAEGGFLPNMDPALAFNGSLSDAAGGATNGGTMTFAPDPAINVTTSVSWYSEASVDRPTSITWNGTTVNRTATGWVIINGTGQLSATNPIVWSGDNNAATTVPTCRAITIDGTFLSAILVDNTGEDYDLMQDSPTQNYATLNPLVPASLNLSSANLTTSYNSVNSVGNSTIAVKDSGKYYWEIQPDFSTNYNVVGIGAPGAIDWTPGPSIVWTSDSSDIIQDAGDFTASNITVTTPYVTGDILGWALDLDSNSCEVFQNGTSRGTFDIDVGNHFVAPIVGNSNASPTTHSNSINYGQQPFIHTPPAGFERLQTQNLPAAPIANGRDHFQAITGSGSGNDGATAGQLGGNWSQYCFNLPYAANTTPDLASIPTLTSQDNFAGPAAAGFDGGTSEDFLVTSGAAVFRPDTPIENVTQIVSQQFSVQRNALNGVDLGNNSQSASNEVIYDGPAVTLESWAAWSISPGANNGGWWTLKVRINGGDLVTLVDFSILAQAQNLFPNGLWWIKDRVNSNQHQLVDSVRGGNLALQCPNNQVQTAYVAPAGNSVAWCWNYNSADPTVNGFEIIDPFETTALQMTVPHNLGAAPEFIISKFITANGSLEWGWRAWHKDLSDGGTLLLSDPGAERIDSSYRVDNVTSTDFEWNSAQQAIVTNSRVIHYAWTSVPGYSAFGSYQGNGNVDGPFVYTGHSVSFILVKSSGSGDWYILDNTRSPFNPAENDLSPNQTIEERTGSRVFDFLSNGFKVRQAYDSINKSGQEYIYAAFAENPTGSSNTSPANAR